MCNNNLETLHKTNPQSLKLLCHINHVIVQRQFCSFMIEVPVLCCPAFTPFGDATFQSCWTEFLNHVQPNDLGSRTVFNFKLYIQDFLFWSNCRNAEILHYSKVQVYVLCMAIASIFIDLGDLALQIFKYPRVRSATVYLRSNITSDISLSFLKQAKFL